MRPIGCCKILAIFVLVVLATAAKADPLVGTTPLNPWDYGFSVVTQAPTGSAQANSLQQFTNSENTFLSSINVTGGVNSYGNTYAGTAMAEGGGGSFSLFASSSLVGGSVSPSSSVLGSDGAAFSEADADMVADFVVPPGVFSMTETITTDGSGISATGSGSVGSYGLLIIDDSEGENRPFIGLDGGTQTFISEFATTPGENVYDQLFIDTLADSYEPGDSAIFDYWGTFSSSFEGYDANGNLVGQYYLPTPTATPEPSTWMLLGSGLLGLAGVVRRRLPRSAI